MLHTIMFCNRKKRWFRIDARPKLKSPFAVSILRCTNTKQNCEVSCLLSEIPSVTNVLTNGHTSVVGQCNFKTSGSISARISQITHLWRPAALLPVALFGLLRKICTLRDARKKSEQIAFWGGWLFGNCCNPCGSHCDISLLLPLIWTFRKKMFPE